MSDETPSPPPGGVPPKPGEAPKVQPKKETVRISLPPKATIKLPSAPPPDKPAVAAPAPAGAPPPVAPKPVTAVPVAPKPPAAPTATAPGLAKPGGAAPAAAAAVAPRPPVPPAAPKRVVAGVAAKKLSPVDAGLAIAAGVLGLVALVLTYLLRTLE